VAAGVAIVAATIWPQLEVASTATSSRAELVRPAPPADGPVRIVDAATSTVWSDHDVAPVKISVSNTSSRAVSARVWWLLAAPGTATPWVKPAARGRPRTIELEAGETRTVGVGASRAVPTGAWTLSLWAHTVRDNGKTQHSHGAATTPTVHVLPTHPDVYRVGEPGGYTALTVVEPVGRLVGIDTETGPDALVSVRATTTQPVAVQLRCYLAPQGTQEPWRSARSYGSHISSGHVEPGAPQAMGCRFPRFPRAGTWELSAFIRLGDADRAGGHEDGLYARGLVDMGGARDDALAAGEGADETSGTTRRWPRAVDRGRRR